MGCSPSKKTGAISNNNKQNNNNKINIKPEKQPLKDGTSSKLKLQDEEGEIFKDFKDSFTFYSYSRQFT